LIVSSSTSFIIVIEVQISWHFQPVIVRTLFIRILVVCLLINTSSLPISTFLSPVVFLFLFFFFSRAINTFAVPQTVSIVSFAAFFVHALDGDNGRWEATITMGVV
jgi:hypothetical protein